MYLRPAEGQNRSLSVGNPVGLAYWQLVRPRTVAVSRRGCTEGVI